MSDERRPGSIVGPLVLRDSRGLHDLRNGVWTGPAQHSDDVRAEDHDVRLMLLVEKHSIFERLRTDRFPERHNCLLAMGGGFPGRAFLAILHAIHAQLRAPLLILTDNDPAGYELFFLVARGAGVAKKQSAGLAIPNALFIGLRTEHAERYGLNEHVQINLGSSERAALKQLQTRSWIVNDNDWQREINALQRRGSKVEVEALHALSPSFLAETYLPERFEAGDYLRLLRA